MIVCGVDGCRGGWVAACKDLQSGRIACQVFPEIRSLLSITPLPAVIGIDIPIGLLAAGPRTCDRAARRLLGRGRASSVFPAPLRPLLEAGSYAEACEIRAQAEGVKLSYQAWGIVPKVREVDAFLRIYPELADICYEVHPEVCFAILNGGTAIQESKKTAAGRQARRALLAAWFGPALEAALSARDRRACAPDDVLDAFAVLWTAGRIAAGTAFSLPAAPPVDAYGLRMAIFV